MALIRSFVCGLLVYGAIVVSYPDWTGAGYHLMTLALIAGGAVSIWVFNKVLDLGGAATKLAVELAFLVALALFLGYTLPQQSGKPPFQQWTEGARPTRAAARKGFIRFGINPKGTAAACVIALFPAR